MALQDLLGQFNAGFRDPAATMRGPIGAEISYQGIRDLLATPTPRATSLLPAVQNLLGSQSEFVQPAIAQIRQGAGAEAAAMQSEAMKRGLTGSDIEMANIRGARAEGESRVAQLLGQVGMQQASQLAQYLMQAAGMDIQTNRETFINLAQAMGQQIAAEQEMRMFREQLASGQDIARQTGRSGILQSLIGAGGQVAGGALKGWLKSGGNPAGAVTEPPEDVANGASNLMSFMNPGR